jgi:hypothetical protein
MHDCCLTPSEQFSSISWSVGATKPKSLHRIVNISIGHIGLRECLKFELIVLIHWVFCLDKLWFYRNLVKVEKLTDVFWWDNVDVCFVSDQHTYIFTVLVSWLWIFWLLLIEVQSLPELSFLSVLAFINVCQLLYFYKIPVKP